MTYELLSIGAHIARIGLILMFLFTLKRTLKLEMKVMNLECDLIKKDSEFERFLTIEKTNIDMRLNILEVELARMESRIKNE